MLSLVISLFLLSACTLPSARPLNASRQTLGVQLKGVLIEEKYRLGKFFVMTQPKGRANDAIFLLAEVALENPAYKDTLRLLGTAYYWAEKYSEAFKLLSRSLIVIKEDEIAWLLYGLTQFRLGDEQMGIDSLKGGLSLLHERSQPGYLGLLNWDAQGLVKRDLHRAAIIVAQAELSRKAELIRVIEILILRVSVEASQDDRSKWISYNRPKDGFSISLPPAWLPVEKPDLSDATWKLLKERNPAIADQLARGAKNAPRMLFSAVDWPPRHNSFGMIGIEALDPPVDVNLNDVGAVIAAKIETLATVEKPVSRRVSLDVGEAGQFLYHMKINTPAGETTLVVNNYIIIKKRKLYQLMRASTPDRTEQNDPVFEKIALSFRWSS